MHNLFLEKFTLLVIPAKTGIQWLTKPADARFIWIRGFSRVNNVQSYIYSTVKTYYTLLASSLALANWESQVLAYGFAEMTEFKGYVA